MLDIGWGELLLMAVLALLVFGPDKLPKVAADAARTLRQVRRMATEARRDLADAAGLQEDQELAETMRDLRSLDPRRVLDPIDDEAPPTRPGRSAPVTGAPQPPAPSPPGAAPAAAAPSASAADPPGAPAGTAPVDPDWT